MRNLPDTVIRAILKITNNRKEEPDMKKILALLLAALLLAACTDSAAIPETTPIPTEPTEIRTDPPTQPPTEEPTAEPTEEPTDPPTEPAYEERLADFQALFSWENGMVYPLSVGHIYETAAEVDLYYLFYNGVNCPGSWDSIAESERDLLIREGLWPEMDIQILPAEEVEKQLQQYFGIGLADVTIPAEWVYSPDTDTYYSNHNDAYVCFATVTGWEALPGGNVRLHLTVDMVHDHDFENVLGDAPMHMTLRPAEAGWQIVSNVIAEE